MVWSRDGAAGQDSCVSAGESYAVACRKGGSYLSEEDGGCEGKSVPGLRIFLHTGLKGRRIRPLFNR